MNAADLKKIADEYEATKVLKQVDSIVAYLQDRASKGHYSCQLYEYFINEKFGFFMEREHVKVLEDKGFHILQLYMNESYPKTRTLPIPVDKYYEISWKNLKEGSICPE